MKEYIIYHYELPWVNVGVGTVEIPKGSKLQCVDWHEMSQTHRIWFLQPVDFSETEVRKFMVCWTGKPYYLMEDNIELIPIGSYTDKIEDTGEVLYYHVMEIKKKED